MRYRVQTIASLALGLALPGAPLAAQGSTKVSVAGFETDGSVGLSRDDYDALGRALSALLSAEVGGRGAATTALAVDPLNSARAGRVDVGAARAAAAKAGAKVLVVGTLLDQYGDIHVEARVLNAVTGEPIAVVRGDPSLVKREQLAQAIADLADRIAQQPAVGGSKGSMPRGSVPVSALVLFGKGLRAEDAGDRTKAAEAYRAAVRAAPGFTEATTALGRVGG
ncbi:MAG: hypothetical protein ABJC19_07270 [Gemmatimonadota bacterium]